MKAAGRFALALVFAFALSACGKDTGSSPDSGGPPPDAGEGAPDATPQNWTPLITGDWSLAAGSENTSDNHMITLDRDIYIGAIRPIAPVGTHHTVLALETLDAGNIIYASGVGTNPLTFPPGVGLKLTSGRQLLLQLHLFNTSDQAISGTSGIEIVEVAAEDVAMEADLYLPGPFTFSIPPMQEYTHSGDCTVQDTQTIFAIFPHMHQLGTYFKTTLVVGGVEMVLHDAPYDFNEQAFVAFEPIELNPGDIVRSECTWYNNTSGTVTWGESSTQEMCFSILYRFPASSGNEFCF